MNRKALLLLMIIFSLGCEKEVDIKQADYTPKVIVDGWIETNNFARIFLTYSSPFLTDYDSASIRKTFNNYAKITLTTGSGDSEILTLQRREEFFPPFVYSTIRIKGKEGEEYHIKIEFSGKIIESSTTIPSFPAVSSVRMNATSDTTATIEASILDPADEANYYYTQIKTLHIDTQYHPSAYPLNSDKSFNGENGTIDIKRSNQPDPLDIYHIKINRGLPEYEFAYSDTVFVKISAIDEEAYQTLNSLFVDQINGQNPFSFVNQKTSTNIKGGLGRWTGLATKQFAVFK